MSKASIFFKLEVLETKNTSWFGSRAPRYELNVVEYGYKYMEYLPMIGNSTPVGYWDIMKQVNGIDLNYFFKTVISPTKYTFEPKPEMFKVLIGRIANGAN